MISTDVAETILYGADFTRADLRGAQLRGADFGSTNLSEINLFRAGLTGSKISALIDNLKL